MSAIKTPRFRENGNTATEVAIRVILSLMAKAAPWGLTTDKRTGGSFGSRLRLPHRPLGVGLEPTRLTVDGEVRKGAAGPSRGGLATLD